MVSDSERNLHNRVIFLSASAAQTQDAVHVINQLNPGLGISLIAWQPAASLTRVVDGVETTKRLHTQVADIFTRVPSSVGLFYQILEVRRKLMGYFRQSGRVVLVLGGDVCPVERSVISFAKRRGIPTVLIQDGLLNDAQSWAQRLAARRRRGLAIQLARRLLHSWGLLPSLAMYGASECRRVAVWGEGTRDLMVEYGVLPEKIVVTGSPRFDRWFALARDRTSIQHNDKSKRRLLYAAWLLSHWKVGSYAEDCRVIASLEALARHEPDWEIVVRPHPSEKIESYQHIFESLGVKHLKLDQKSSLLSALSDCALIMTYGSTVAIEGMILGKPVLCLPMDPVQAPLYVREGAVVAVDSLDDLGDWIKAVLSDSKLQTELTQRRQAFISRHLGYTDGTSSSRVARLIESSLLEYPVRQHEALASQTIYTMEK